MRRPFFRRPGPFGAGFLTGSLVALVSGAVLLGLAKRATGQSYQDLRVVDLRGRLVDLATLADRPLVVNYWATWCKPCLEEFPAFERARKRYGARVAFVMISDDPPAKAARALANKGFGFTFCLSPTPIRINVRPVTERV